MSWTDDEAIRIAKVETALLEVRSDVTEIKVALLGFEGHNGVLRLVGSHEERLANVEKAEMERQGERKTVMAILAFASATAGGILVAVVEWML